MKAKRVVTPDLEKAITDVVVYLDEAMSGDDVNPFPLAKLRDALLKAFDEAQPRPPSYATLEEAKAAVRADFHCPRDVSDDQLEAWARPFVRGPDAVR